jgi:battenin
MLLIALTPTTIDGGTVRVKMLGVILASLSSGGGELSFLGLTHYYGHFSLAAWGSGTGGAGLIGAGAYVIATTSLGLSVRTSLLAFSFLPVIMLVSFFIILPRSSLSASGGKLAGYESIDDDEQYDPPDEIPCDDDVAIAGPEENEGLLNTSTYSASGRSFTSMSHSRSSAKDAWKSLKANLAHSRGLFFL